MCNLRFRAELSLRTLALAGRAVPGEVAGVKAACPRRERHSIGSGPGGFLPGGGDHGEAGFGQVASERGRESPHGHARPAGNPAAPPGRWASDVPGTPGSLCAGSSPWTLPPRAAAWPVRALLRRQLPGAEAPPAPSAPHACLASPLLRPSSSAAGSAFLSLICFGEGSSPSGVRTVPSVPPRDPSASARF